jgi:hypothetical protein
MELLNKYFELQKEIYNYFGYKEGFVSAEIDDCRKYFWTLKNDFEEEISFSLMEENQINSLKDMEEDDEWVEPEYNFYLCNSNHFPKVVFRGEDYTMIVIDTQVENNILLSIFDNKKELKEVDYED